MRSVTTFNDGWLFEGKEVVTLPHTAVELPFAYFDETAYQRPFTYSKTFGNDRSFVVHGADAGFGLYKEGLWVIKSLEGLRRRIFEGDVSIHAGRQGFIAVAMVVAVRQALDYTSTARAVAVCTLGFVLAGGMAMVIGILFSPAVY